MSDVLQKAVIHKEFMVLLGSVSLGFIDIVAYCPRVPPYLVKEE